MLLPSIFRIANESPTRLALAHNDTLWTYADLARATLEAEDFLSTQSIPPGSLVGIALSNLRLSWILILALEKMGHTSTALPWQAAATDLQLRGVHAWISDGSYPTTWIERTITVPSSFASNPDPSRPLPESVDEVKQIVRHILFSSGTTGNYKLLPSREPLRTQRIQDAVKHGRETPGDRHFVGWFGPWTAHGYHGPTRSWSSGSFIIFDQTNEPWSAIVRYKPNRIFLTPGIALQLLSRQPKDCPRQDQLHITMSGGALTPKLLDAIQSRITNDIEHSYGSTEVGIVARTQIRSVEDLDHHTLTGLAQLEIVDDDDNPLPPGRTGRVRIKSPSMHTTYMNDASASQAFFRQGWFYPGDLGRFNDDGTFALTGRDNEVINFWGDKLAPSKIEEPVKLALGCQDVAALSVPNPPSADKLFLFVVHNKPTSRDELARAIKPFGPAFSSVEIRNIQAIPRTTTGKILYRELREKFLA